MLPFFSLKPKPERKPKLSSAAILVRLRLITNGSQNYGGAIDDKSKFAYVAQNYPGITSCGIKCHSSSEISLLKECLYIRTLSTTGVAIYLSYSFARNLRSCPWNTSSFLYGRTHCWSLVLSFPLSSLFTYFWSAVFIYAVDIAVGARNDFKTPKKFLNFLHQLSSICLKSLLKWKIWFCSILHWNFWSQILMLCYYFFILEWTFFSRLLNVFVKKSVFHPQLRKVN